MTHVTIHYDILMLVSPLPGPMLCTISPPCFPTVLSLGWSSSAVRWWCSDSYQNTQEIFINSESIISVNQSFYSNAEVRIFQVFSSCCPSYIIFTIPYFVDIYCFYFCQTICRCFCHFLLFLAMSVSQLVINIVYDSLY